MGKQHFIYIIRPVRDNFLENPTPQENKIMEDHFQHLKLLREKGTLCLAGPSPAGKFGIVIFKADSMDEAGRLMNEDPAVKNGIMNAEVFDFRLSLTADDC